MKKYFNVFFIVILFALLLVPSNVLADGQWTVTFELDGGSMESPSQVTVNDGGKVTKPSQKPTKHNYSFDNWYADSEGNTLFDFTQPITKTTTIYARWTEYISLAMGTTTGGSYSCSGTSAYNETGSINLLFLATNNPVTFTATPDDGYHFVGWYEGIISEETHFVNAHTSTLISSSSPYTATINGSMIVMAVFEEDTDGPITNSRVQVIMGELADNDRGTYTISGGTYDGKTSYSSTKSDFFDLETSITLTATPDKFNKFVGWYEAEEYDTTGAAKLGVMGWRAKGNALSTNSSYTFKTEAAYYNIMPVFESKSGHNNIWMTGDGEIAVLYENRNEEQTNLDGKHWVNNGIVVDYIIGDEITLKAREKEESHFVGWFITDRAASVPANYVREPMISSEATYTYKPGETTIKVDGEDEILNYITAVFEDDSVLRIISGANQTYVRGSKKTISIVASGDLDKLIAVEIDNGNPLTDKDMTLSNGSTRLTFANSFLENSSLGEHTITFVYDEGEIETTLTIEEPVPKTWDSIDTYITLFILSIIMLGLTKMCIRKYRFN